MNDVPTTMWMSLRRRLGCDHNPLRRRTDRLAALLLPAVVAAFLLLAPLAAVLAGQVAQHGNTTAQQAQQSWHPVPAVLLAGAPGPLFRDGGSNSWTVWAPARWTAAGHMHSGLVPATSGTRSGTTITIWLDRAGVPRLPLSSGAARYRIVTTIAIAVTALALLLAVAAMVIRSELDHRRLASWETAWLSVGPQWSSR